MYDYDDEPDEIDPYDPASWDDPYPLDDLDPLSTRRRNRGGDLL